MNGAERTQTYGLIGLSTSNRALLWKIKIKRMHPNALISDFSFRDALPSCCRLLLHALAGLRPRPRRRCGTVRRGGDVTSRCHPILRMHMYLSFSDVTQRYHGTRKKGFNVMRLGLRAPIVLRFLICTVLCYQIFAKLYLRFRNINTVNTYDDSRSEDSKN